MRRVTGLIFAGLGSFLIVLALLLRFYVAGQAIKAPLNEDTVSTLTAGNVSYFSQAQLTEVTGATMRDTTTVQGDVAAGSSSRAVWNEFSYLYDATSNQAFQYSLERLAFDRRSGELINCCGTFVGTKANVHVSGLGLTWPIGTQKKTYEVFDTTLMRPMPASYEGTAVVDGETTYKFVENVPATPAGTQTLPGSLVGIKGAQTVTLNEYYQDTTTQWVDPASGYPVKIDSAEHLYLGNSASTPVLTLLQGNFSSTAGTVAAAVKTAKHDDGEISLLTLILPATFALLGIIVLAMGGILARRRGEQSPAAEQAVDYEGSGVVTA